MFGRICKKAAEYTTTPDAQKLLGAAQKAFKENCAELEAFAKNIPSNESAMKGLEQLSNNIRSMLLK